LLLEGLFMKVFGGTSSL